MTTSKQLTQSFDPQRCGQRLLEFLEGGEDIYVVCPFITRTGLEPILETLSPSARLTVYTRWNAKEVAEGVSDPEILDILAARDSALYLNSLLHAKAFIRRGQGALVGSANVTGKGLGFSALGGIELLVSTPENIREIERLMFLLETTSVLASKEIQEQVLEQAKLFSEGDRNFPAEYGPSPEYVAWLPSFLSPRALYAVYIGARKEERDVEELAKPDLDVLNPPDNLSRTQFEAYVGNILLQGLPGRIGQELVGLSTFQAIRRLEELGSDAGVTLDDPEQAWKALAAWLTYFLPSRYKSGPGGKKLIP